MTARTPEQRAEIESQNARTVRSLEMLSNAANRTTTAQLKLSEINERIANKTNFAEGLLTSNPLDLLKKIRGIGSAIEVGINGKKLTDLNKTDMIGALENFGPLASIGVLNQNAKRNAMEKAFPNFFKGDAKERNNLQNDINQIFVNSEKAFDSIDRALNVNISNMGANIDRLSSSINSIPNRIDLQASHDIHITFNGVDVLRELQPGIKTMVINAVNAGLNKNISQNGATNPNGVNPITENDLE
jgi:hypothetical protein